MSLRANCLLGLATLLCIPSLAVADGTGVSPVPGEAKGGPTKTLSAHGGQKHSAKHDKNSEEALLSEMKQLRRLAQQIDQRLAELEKTFRQRPATLRPAPRAYLPNYRWPSYAKPVFPPLATPSVKPQPLPNHVLKNDKTTGAIPNYVPKSSQIFRIPNYTPGPNTGEAPKLEWDGDDGQLFPRRAERR